MLQDGLGLDLGVSFMDEVMRAINSTGGGGCETSATSKSPLIGDDDVSDDVGNDVGLENKALNGEHKITLGFS